MSNVTTRPAQTEAEKAKQSAADAVGHAGQAAQDAASKAKQSASAAVGHAGQAAQEVAHAAGQKVQDFAQTAQDKAREAAQAAGHKAEDATAALGSSMKTAAEMVRGHTPHDGSLGRASEAVADTLEKGGAYLQEKNLHGMAEDVTEMIKRNPIPAVLVGVGLGFLLGRTLRS